jgi:O-antigen/teichoic acid export membrane protein
MLPALVALVAFADPLLPWLLGGLLTDTGVDQLVTMIRILAVVAIPWAFFLVSSNALHALQRWNLTIWLALAAVATHAAFVVPLAGEEPEIVTAGHAAAVAVIAAIVVRAALGPRPLRPVWSALVRSAPAAALALVIVGARLLAGSDPDAALALGALVVGLLAYVSLVLVLRPTVRTRLASLVGR